jgi:nitrogen PTS system EIIA component
MTDLLRPDAVRVGVLAATKKALFAAAGQVAQDVLQLDPEVVADRLADREKLGSTGFGGGAAIPHARIPGLPAVGAIALRLAQPIDWKAMDEVPVSLALVLLSPPEAGADHLKALARISRRLRRPAFVAKLLGAGSPDALYALWSAEDALD